MTYSNPAHTYLRRIMRFVPVLMFIIIGLFLVTNLTVSREPGALGETLYVDGGAPEGGNGTLDHPFTTIGRAVENASAGHVIRVFAGVYNESVNISPGVPLSMVGNGSSDDPAAGTIINGTGSGSTILIAAHGCTVSHLRITGSGNGPEDAGVRVDADTDNASLATTINLTGIVATGNMNGIFLINTRNVVVTGCTLTGNSAHGLLTVGSVNITLEHQYFGLFSNGIS